MNELGSLNVGLETKRGLFLNGMVIEMTKNRTMWHRLVSKTGIWLAVEIWFNLLGVDEMADYSEYLLRQDCALKLKNCQTVKISEQPPQYCPQIEDYCPIPRTATKLTTLEGLASRETWKNKCQQLATPCLKMVCLETKTEVEV